MSQIIKINRLEEAALDVYATTSEVSLLRYREPEPGIFIAESPVVIERALDTGYCPLSVLMDEREVSRYEALLERIHTAPIYVAEFDVLTRITGFKLTRGMLCAMQRKALLSAESLCEGKHRIAVLEDVVNPTNIGAIFRSAAALGMDAVLLTSGCADPLYRRAIRVSMGTVFQIPWTYFPKKSDATIETLHALGFQSVAMALRKDSVDIQDTRFRAIDKLAVVLGTEGEGLRDTTIDRSDYTVRIPMAHGVDSLNVAAASAVAFWELSKREII